MVLVIIILTAVASIVTFNNRAQQEKMLFVPYCMDDPKQWYRFVSHGLIHADWSHLIFNMISLHFAGMSAERWIVMIKGEELGSLYFIALYVLGMIAASIPSFIKNRTNPGYRSLGASGAVAAVLFFFIPFEPLAGINILFIPFSIPAWIFGILYLVSEYYLDKRQHGHVAHDAHFFGALFGLLFAVIIHPPVLGSFIDQIKQALGAL